VRGGPFTSDPFGSYAIFKLIIDSEIYATPRSRAMRGIEGPNLFPPPGADHLYAELLEESRLFTWYEW